MSAELDAYRKRKKLEYQRQWQAERKQGQLRTVDPRPAQRHIMSLLAQGASVRGIAGVSGVQASTISLLSRGEIKQLHKDREAALLAVTLTQVLARPDNPEGFVPAFAARRRLRALLRMGWRWQDLEAMGLKQPACKLHQTGRWINKSTHDAICAVYDELCMKPGPSKTTITRVTKRGYAPPLAWDDIDDPTMRPDMGDDLQDAMYDEIAVGRLLNGQLKAKDAADVDKVEAIRRLHEQGLPDGGIGSRIGTNIHTVRKYRKDNLIGEIE